jgi:orotidine-5'-phosphate decarboxylase
MTDAKNCLIFALDVSNIDEGIELLRTIHGHVGLVKIGLELFTSTGPRAVEEVKHLGFDVFLDLKLHDIPNTVAHAVKSARALGVSMLTVHTGGGEEMLRRAAEEAGDAIQILGVTLLTSLGEEDLSPVAIVPDATEVVRRRALLARKAGIDGIVCSPKEIKTVRQCIGPHGTIVTPGIRPQSAAVGDQKRAATPKTAIAEGADYLVVGRPIRTASNPAQAASNIVREIHDALNAR